MSEEGVESKVELTAGQIVSLTNREACQLIQRAELERLAEIDRFWALCQAGPAAAAPLLADAPRIVNDLALLADCSNYAPRADQFPSLVNATAGLLSVDTVRDALNDDGGSDTLIALFWDHGVVVAAKTCMDRRVLAVRFDGPLFNPGTVPQAHLTGTGSLYLACEQAQDSTGGSYEYLSAYVFGCVDGDGNWAEVYPGLHDRSELMRDLKAMEVLVRRGRLSGHHFIIRPLTSFPTPIDGLIAQLKAHQGALRSKGEMPPGQRIIVDGRTAPLRKKIETLRRHASHIENEVADIRLAIANIEAAALEEETGFAAGDRVRHTVTDDEGVLEIVSFGYPQFRLAGTLVYVTEDIRRGEWVKSDDTAPSKQGLG